MRKIISKKQKNLSFTHEIMRDMTRFIIERADSAGLTVHQLSSSHVGYISKFVKKINYGIFSQSFPIFAM